MSLLHRVVQTDLRKNRHAYTSRPDLLNGASLDFLALLVPEIQTPQLEKIPYFATLTPSTLRDHNTNASSDAKCDQFLYRKEFSATLFLCIFGVSATLKVL